MVQPKSKKGRSNRASVQDISRLTGYDRVETALYNLLVTKMTPEFNTRNVAQGHFRYILDNASSITITPGSSTHNNYALQTVMNEWNINLQLFMKQTNIRLEDFYQRIRIRRQQIKDTIDLYPTLDETPNVVFTLVVGQSEPEWIQISRTYLWTQDISVKVNELVVLPRKGEYYFSPENDS